MRHVKYAGTAKQRIFECIGIGFGPSNIALAISLEERGLLANSLFLEARATIAWHPDMMMPGSDIQHNPLRDLVTPRNPASRYGFLSYLKENGRLFDYLNLDAPYPPRSDYNQYVKWVGEQFCNNVLLSKFVTSVETSFTAIDGALVKVETSDGEVFWAKTLSVAPGRSPNIPACFTSLLGDRVIHLENYLSSATRWREMNPAPRVGVVGGSQSAIEIILDLMSKFPDGKIVNICRGFGFKQKDLSPFTEMIYYPDFVDYYFNAPHDMQKKITHELKRSNYSAADHDVISALNFKIYEQKISGRSNLSLKFCREIVGAHRVGSEFSIDLLDMVSGQNEAIGLDFVILATGYKNFGSGDGSEPIHPILRGISPQLRFRPDGGVDIARDYQVIPKGRSVEFPRIFVNGLCESTHGFGDAGSFSLLSVRSDIIASSIAKALEQPRLRVGVGQ
ncbi:SidA/IucD/PvdA family monooxygenase [Bradyrhizobium sp. SSUT77]|uniref:SidA/IucD/PvdA family monooxygenase n=1 Tax=Bradyrhizobium sp. SSUT77 TaxID=3040603 RepID=UPI00244929FB|nr:SidA/IucD/PvdA family monooxygenase [Bradyrhizobium sp. SSUT77]MDH2343606.1 SidA/IucD/PvdA family monooxygenase [Bradyrhizobium sp. SSUT77]